MAPLTRGSANGFGPPDQCHNENPDKALKPHDFIHLEISNYNQQTPEVTKLYEKGLSLRDIEARLGISKTKVRSLLLAAGIALRDSIKERQRVTQGSKSKKAVKPPYGFCFYEGQVVRHPKEYPHLLAIIQRWKSGQPLNSIATWLNGKKVRSPLQLEGAFVARAANPH